MFAIRVTVWFLYQTVEPTQQGPCDLHRFQHDCDFYPCKISVIAEDACVWCRERSRCDIHDTREVPRCTRDPASDCVVDRTRHIEVRGMSDLHANFRRVLHGSSVCMEAPGRQMSA